MDILMFLGFIIECCAYKIMTNRTSNKFLAKYIFGQNKQNIYLGFKSKLFTSYISVTSCQV